MDSEYGTPGMSDNEVLGVLTGQVPVKSAPIAMAKPSHIPELDKGFGCKEKPECGIIGPHFHE